MEKVISDITHPRLTIAKNRITLKFPLDFPEEERQRVTLFAEKVCGLHYNSNLLSTLRGRFYKENDFST